MARRHLKRVMEHLEYVGVLTIEFFVVDGRLVANEMAPRVHNSGHWTIEGCVTSQFENHLRAICGLPLGSTRALGHAAMVNFLGQMPAIERLLAIDGLAFHDYGKEPRAGRKLGHCTVLRSGARDRNRALAGILKLVDQG
jgi:5-(carboxyamino)imidazole ribonucleotide synthase